MWGIPSIDLGTRASEDIRQKAPKTGGASYRDWDIGQEAKLELQLVRTSTEIECKMAVRSILKDDRGDCANIVEDGKGKRDYSDMKNMSQ